MNTINKTNKPNDQVLIQFYVKQSERVAAHNRAREMGYRTLSEYMRAKLREVLVKK